ncbi:FAD binding domain-containing protein [Nocardia aurantia]|uniref:6-hydroxypseudooxynicotine dehydrogenase complex subunit alpha n=1 Tax=Nocardia aurantia TaxID=2585199 RepID=A0A7K0DSL1_9NOCA|nr:xanthine dehydrogenase family protein subunit M [Nocardia aurantia]MQY28706.1 6-hydroxypseudooxynicotine dehydrogenase complex subunit alpha [Nocardia aurantia]
MKPPPFDYVVPRSVADAVGLLSASDREVKILAGGQSLIPVLNMRMAYPEVLVDICRLPELRTIETTATGAVRIAAAVTQAEAAADERIRAGWPLLAAAIGHIGHPQIRNRGTVCGSLAHADSAAELPCAAVILDAILHVTGPDGDRRIPAAEFFLGTFATVLEPGELLVAVEFPALPTGTGWSFDEFAHRRGDFATVAVGATLRRDGDAVAGLRLVACGVGGTPVRATHTEAALTGRIPGPELSEVIAAAVRQDLRPPADVHATAEFRLELAAHLIGRAVTAAWERAA